MSRLFSSLLKTKTVSGVFRNQTLKITLCIAFSLLAIWLVATLLWKPKNKHASNLSPKLRELTESFKVSREKTDPFVREYFIQQEANRFHMTANDYEKLMSIRRQDGNILPDAPTGNSPLKWILWFYEDVPQEQRLGLIFDGFLWTIEKAAGFTVVVAGIRFFLEIPQRERQAKYQAWQVVHAAYGQRVSGARIAALEDLRDQGESFAGVALKGASLDHIHLEGSDLKEADLAGVTLCSSNLKGANLEGVDFFQADLRNAVLFQVNLKGANLFQANLEGANLEGANLEGANLQGANLKEAVLFQANLKGANLQFQIAIQNTNLEGANFKEANLEGAHFEGVKAQTVDQIKSARNWEQAHYDPEFRKQLGLPPETLPTP